MNKITGILLTGASTVLFIILASGEFRQPFFGFIPAVVLGIAGMTMLMRRDGVMRQQPVPSDIADRLMRIEDALSSVVIDLDSTQNNVKRLTEERAFLERLLAERKSDALAEIGG